jgi:hypothetical protein
MAEPNPEKRYWGSSAFIARIKREPKVLCHNLVVLIHEMYELGIDPVFWADEGHAQESGA